MFSDHSYCVHTTPEYSPVDRNTICVYNAGTAVIAAGTAVTFSGSPANVQDQTLILSGETATSDQIIWGIAAESIMPHTSGNVIMNGIARTCITGSGQFAAPGSDGKLVAGSSGKALILHPGNETTPGIVQLGYSGGDSDEYKGYFKIIRVDESHIAVVNGHAPTTEFCGHTDLPGAQEVPRCTLPLPSPWPNGAVFSVDLYACCNDGVYSVVISTSGTPPGSFERIYLGWVGQWNLGQSYREDSTISFGRQWYL